MAISKPFVKQVWKFGLQAGMSQEEPDYRLTTPQIRKEQISRYELEKTEPKIDQAIRFTKALNVSLDKLVTLPEIVEN